MPGESGGSLLFSVLTLELMKDFQPLKSPLDFQIFLQELLSVGTVYSRREPASLYSLCADAAMLHRRKCLIIAEEIKNRKTHLSWASSYLSLSAVMDDNLGVECVCLSIAAVQSDQGQAPTEKGPVPQLMSSIIQMESLLSVHSAVVCTLLQAASPDALSVYRLLKCMWGNLETVGSSDLTYLTVCTSSCR